MTPMLQAAGRRRYVSLTTFRKSGVGVATPVWIAPDGDALVVMTAATTGKVKRLRRDGRVELRECTASGKVREGAPVVTADAEVVEGEPRLSRGMAALQAKYGWQFRLVLLIERLAARGEHPRRVVLRIRAA